MSEGSQKPVIHVVAGLDPKTVGRYELLERLGEGGAGVVYRAKDGASGDVVALKLLRQGDLADAEHRRRFLREARLAAALEHEGVVRVREVDEADGHVFLAMDVAPGTSMRRRLDAARAEGVHLPVATALAIARAVAEAVAHAHAKGIVHRDLKPDNVMVTDDLRVQVLDFGLAKMRETTGGMLYEAETETSLTNDGRVLGTPSYMSPEQATGKEVGLRSDVFSLGVVLYELLASHRPFAGATSMDVIIAITRDTPPPPSASNPAVSPEIDALVMRCLAKKPQDRPDMAELARELARPELARVVKTSRRGGRPLLVALGATAAASALALVALRAQPAKPAAPSPSASAAPAILPTAVLDLPLPSSASPEVLAAYRDGMRAEHDGAVAAAHVAFQKALELDPALAAAHLRLAIQMAFFEANDARAHFAQAVKFHDRLSPRDEALLEASRPLFQRDPADVDELLKRLAPLAARFPGDAELAYQIGTLRSGVGELRDEPPIMERAIAIDPSFGLALAELAQAQAYLGDFDAARATITQCIARVPRGGWCLWFSEAIEADRGHCEKFEALARQEVASDPAVPSGYEHLTLALMALGRPEPSVRATLEQALARIKEETERKRTALSFGHRIDLGYGHLADAATHMSELEAIVAARSDVGEHANVAYEAASIELEMGHTARAAKIADAFLARREAWVADPIPHDYTISRDVTPLLASLAYHAGSMKKEEFESTMQAWRAAWDGRLRGAYAPYLWVYGYAAVVETPEEAREAVAALERYEPIPPFIPNGAILPIAIGRTLWLAGREDEGLSYLERGARSCDRGGRPIVWVRGNAFLGDALAKRGDVKGACAAYGAAVARLGNAKPKSVTADYARARRAALSCDTLK